VSQRAYTLTLTLVATFGRRIQARTHAKRLARVLERAGCAPWVVGRVESRSRLVRASADPAEVQAQRVATRQARLLDHVDRRLPERAWLRDVLKAEGLLRSWWVTLGRTKRGRAQYATRTIRMGRPGSWPGAGSEYPLVTAWLAKHGASPQRVNGFRYRFLHEVAHALHYKRRTRPGWFGSDRKAHGPQFRRTLFGLLTRHAPEFQVPAQVPGEAAGSPPEVSHG
jgi:hypothetical protein